MGASRSNILLESGTNEVEILDLFIEEEGYCGHYGVNVAKILEIIPMPRLMSPPHLKGTSVAGMFNHRGKIICLIDLAVWLGRQRVAQGTPKVIVTEFNNVVTGFIVSGVNRIYRVPWSDIRPLDSGMETFSDDVTGVMELEQRLVFLLDLEKALADLNPSLAISDALDSPHLGAEGAAYRPIRLLHADDSAVIRSTVKRRLEENGIFAVHSVSNGDEAWAFLEEANRQHGTSGAPLSDLVEAVLTDIEMPGMDGYHLCKRIKENKDLSAIPVVLFSSLITEKLFHKGEAVGADGQFAKPDLELMHFLKGQVEKIRQGAAQSREYPQP